MNIEINTGERAEADTILWRDPANAYSKMDSLSRERYLNATMQFARRANLTAPKVASAVLALSCAADVETPKRHVGYYLISDGRYDLMGEIGVNPTLVERVQHLSDGARLALYATAVGACSLVGSAAWVNAAPPIVPQSIILFATLTCVFVAMTHLGVQITNQVVRLLFPPKRLPRLDFTDGVPPEFRTLLAVPCMLTSARAIEELSSSLESIYKGNADRHLGFCLVTDFLDAEQQHEPSDIELLDVAAARIESLNNRHGGGFVWLHRDRTWNALEGSWMGRERKRGKLEDLNAALVANAPALHFCRIAGDTEKLRSVRFVITLDDDMGLQPGDARRMIATLAHPLNLPLIAQDDSKVVGGYGLLQPSLHAVMPAQKRTRYESLYGTIAISADATGVKASVYQDFFEQASYCGKGIYDVHAFHRVLHRSFPENLVLSHDMLEGAFVRAGLLSDVVVLEDIPSTYLSNMQRRHRWLRGDWQTLPWLLPRVPSADGGLTTNHISPLGVWLTIDNVRRIIAPIALLAAFVFGMFYSAKPEIWAMFTLAVPVLPVVTSLCLHIWLNGRKTSSGMVRTLAYRWLSATFLNLAFIVYESMIGADAVIRSSFRMIYSKRKLLEWIPQSIVNAQLEANLTRHYSVMWLSPVGAAVMGVSLLVTHPSSLLAAGPFLLTWMVAPAIAWWLSRPAREID